MHYNYIVILVNRPESIRTTCKAEAKQMLMHCKIIWAPKFCLQIKGKGDRSLNVKVNVIFAVVGSLICRVKKGNIIVISILVFSKLV